MNRQDRNGTQFAVPSVNTFVNLSDARTDPTGRIDSGEGMGVGEGRGELHVVSGGKCDGEKAKGKKKKKSRARDDDRFRREIQRKMAGRRSRKA